MMTTSYVLSEGNTATTDYFLYPYLQAQGYTPSLLDSRKPPVVPHVKSDSLVVLARYLPQNWRRTVVSMKVRGCKLVYFMDDDLFDFRALNGLPWRYRWKIISQALTQQRILKSLCDEIWVSTTYLLNKYAEYKPRLIQASPPAALIEGVSSPKIHVCYHATSSHRQEIAWLADVVSGVQSNADNTYFEIFGGAEVKRYYGTIPRVSVMHPMKWPQYLEWSRSVHRDIALAPILPSAFNAARGPTKFFDYVRIGAAGIYTDSSPYRGFVQNGKDGLLVDNNPDDWVRAVLELASDHARRKLIVESARRRVLANVEENELLVCC